MMDLWRHVENDQSIKQRERAIGGKAEEGVPSGENNTLNKTIKGISEC